ncbi:hypothetical protein [Thermofilum pendens]
MLKKVLVALGIAVAAVIIVGAVLLGLGLWYAATPPAKFEVGSVEVVDHNGYPALRVSFTTDKYPVDFYLLTPEGEKVDYASASEPERVVYLHLTYEPYANIAEEKRYVVKAFYLKSELWSREVTVKGVKPEVEVSGLNCSVYGLFGLVVEGAVVRVRNLGDAPLYATSMSVKAYLDGEEKAVALEATVVPPGGAREFRVKLPSPSIEPKLLGRDHAFEVEVAGVKAGYAIPKLAPEVKLVDRGYGEFLGTVYLSNATISIANNWRYPLHVNWIKVYVNGREVLWRASPAIETVEAGKTATLTLDFLPLSVKKGDRVKIAIGATEVEFTA